MLFCIIILKDYILQKIFILLCPLLYEFFGIICQYFRIYSPIIIYNKVRLKNSIRYIELSLLEEDQL